MMSKEFIDISSGFRFSKLQFGSVPSIPVAVLVYFNGGNCNYPYLWRKIVKRMTDKKEIDHRAYSILHDY